MAAELKSESSCALTGSRNAPATMCSKRKESTASPAPSHHGSFDATVSKSSKNRSRFAIARLFPRIRKRSFWRNFQTVCRDAGHGTDGLTVAGKPYLRDDAERCEERPS